MRGLTTLRLLQIACTLVLYCIILVHFNPHNNRAVLVPDPFAVVTVMMGQRYAVISLLRLFVPSIVYIRLISVYLLGNYRFRNFIGDTSIITLITTYYWCSMYFIGCILLNSSYSFVSSGRVEIME